MCLMSQTFQCKYRLLRFMTILYIIMELIRTCNVDRDVPEYYITHNTLNKQIFQVHYQDLELTQDTIVSTYRDAIYYIITFFASRITCHHMKFSF